ncbi:MAG: calcium/sodium antiporter [Leptospiraceae bacterium]|nr:calcium/sodium antiporter [Leptospiraceae bacterium]
MLLASCAIVFGLLVLFWSADQFVIAAVRIAWQARISPLLIGMLIIGFGTSLPELLVSALAAGQANAGLALGNAFGSNITNIALILGLTALIHPIRVQSGILRRELPVLTVVTLLAAALVFDGEISRLDGAVLLAGFGIFLGWSIWQASRNPDDSLGQELTSDRAGINPDQSRLRLWLRAAGALTLLVGSSRILVWGAIEIAHYFQIDDLFIGLTIVALGTSLPELASSLAAARRHEHDLALGNVIGSNIFNTLAVVGLAGLIRPLECGAAVFWRDTIVMTGLTLSLFLFGYRFGRSSTGRINRLEGSLLLIAWLAYTAWLVRSALLTDR